ncbi:membrane protein FxsA [Pararhizobium sp. BT-229]|uniref:FxsA family protein n=1 Tax=Pararhizobium sp. BT-229 TaxID=2986923 RepID=UPI0021F7E305|nr:FxsA family protein [Pararhizobium sp. BT-229]MCV9967353.1 membrane protein FxsA [Pararhizobium sp. BT-229]
MRTLIIPLLFLLMPLAEIAAFIFVGREVGVGMTLLLVLGSAIAGAVLLRIQGFGVLRKIQQASQTGTDPGRQLVHGVMIVIAAFLLIIPGFISDIIGLLLFIPAVRDIGWSLIKSRLTIVTTGGMGGFSRGPAPDRDPRRRSDPQVIDLDEDEFSRTEGRGRTDPNERDRLK